jgi:hypothetical protein
MAYNPQDEYKQAQKLAAMLNKSIDTAYAPGIAEYGRQIETAPAQFNPYRNSAEVQARIQAQTVNEQMANAGLSASGSNLTAQTAVQTGKQTALKQINAQQAALVQKLKSELNAYIAQRDAAKYEGYTGFYQQAGQNVTAFNQQAAQAAQQQKYALEQMRVANSYNTSGGTTSSTSRTYRSNTTNTGNDEPKVVPLTTEEKNTAKALGTAYNNKIDDGLKSASEASVEISRQYAPGSEGWQLAMEKAGLVTWTKNAYVLSALKSRSTSGDAGLVARALLERGDDAATTLQWMKSHYGLSGTQLAFAMNVAGFKAADIQAQLSNPIYNPTQPTGNTAVHTSGQPVNVNYGQGVHAFTR